MLWKTSLRTLIEDMDSCLLPFLTEDQIFSSVSPAFFVRNRIERDGTSDGRADEGHYVTCLRTLQESRQWLWAARIVHALAEKA